MWPTERVDAFLTQCIVHKKRVQVEEPSIQVWKDIASTLGKSGHAGTTWQMCRAKMHSLNEFFVGSLLRTGGTLGGVRCPHYTKLCTLHDLPPDYELPVPISDAANSKYQHSYKVSVSCN